MKNVGKCVKDNWGLFVIVFITVVFSIITIKESVADCLTYGYPPEGTDFSTISWAEVAIDENGQDFSIYHDTWGIEKIGVRLLFDNADADSSFELVIEDEEGQKETCEYNVQNLKADDDDVTWLDVGARVTPGIVKLTFRNIDTAGLKVLSYSQFDVYDQNGQPAFTPSMKILAASYPKSKAIAFSVAWILLVFALIILLKYKPISYEKLFVITYLIFGILAFIVYPPFSEPDSGNHYRRAYAISQNDVCPELDENNAIGGYFAWPNNWAVGDTVSVSWYEASGRMDFDVTAPDNQRYLTYTNIALYSPICHLVPAMGMKIARHFTHSIIVIERVAEIFNFIAIGIVLYLGIRITPFGKEFFIWIVLHPFIMKLYSSISPDVMTVALVYLLTALVLRLRFDPDAYAKKGYLVALYIVPFLLGQFKIVYVAFCLLLFLIPMKKFSSKKSYFANAAAIGVVTFAPALSWLVRASKILGQGYANTSETNKKIVLDVFKYANVLMKTIVKRGFDYLMQFFGSTLVFKDGTNEAVVLVFLMLVTAFVAVKAQKSKHNHSEVGTKIRTDIPFKVILVISVVITTYLIFTAEYVQWTDPGASDINGVSGRYFFPFFFPVLILLTDAGGTQKVDGEEVNARVCGRLLSLASIALCFVAQLFIVYQL